MTVGPDYPHARRILLVEDEEAHAEIVRRAFERHGVPFHLSVASTLAAAGHAMDGQAFDLVIADWRLPDGEGIDLLNGRPAFPLLLMTSHGSERMAVDAMRSGAVDYVAKTESSLTDMPTVAERAIRLWRNQAAVEVAQAKLRIAEDRLRVRRQEEGWFRLVVEGAPSAMIMVCAEGFIRLVNSQAENLFGYGREKLLGQPVDMLVPDRFRDNHLYAVDYYSATPRLNLFGTRADGSEVPIEIGRSLITATEGQFVLASIVDITERMRGEARVALAERRFRRLLDASPVGIVEADREGRIGRANEAFYQLIGWDRQAFAEAGLDLRKITPDESRPKTDSNLRASHQTGRSVVYESEYCRRDGSRVPVMVGLSVSDAAPDDIIAFTVDLSEQKETERQIRLLADAMPQIVWTSRPDGYLDYYNRRWYDFTGNSPGAGGDESWLPVLHPDDRQYCLDTWYAAVATGILYDIHYRFWDRKTNLYRWHLGRALPLRDESGTILKWVGTCTDIDDHKRLSDELEQRVASRTIELQQSLLEKTTLLKEVHHRVKNNLQVICSLLSMQVACSDAALAAPLQQAHRRVLAMSLIHEQIYQSETLSDLDFGGYIGELAGYLFRAYCIDSSRIRLELSTEAIHLPIDDAIPCGLILNELLSNSLKHAFPEGRGGIIGVSLRRIGGDLLELAVRDDGVGLSADFQMESARSLGLRVVNTLVGQLGAELRIGRAGGTVFTLIWPGPKGAASASIP